MRGAVRGILGFLGAGAAGAILFVGGVLLFGARPVVLFTDVSVWLLIMGIVGFLLYAATREQYRIAWRQLRARRLPMLSMGILLLYLATGLLDSFHLQRRARDERGALRIDETGAAAYENEILSVLDLCLWGLKTRAENTYSAPFSLFEATPTTEFQPDGSRKQTYRRLRFAAPDLRGSEEVPGDVAVLALEGLGLGLLFGAAALGLCVGASALFRRSLRAGLWVGGFLGAVIGVGVLVGMLSSRYHVLGTSQVGQDILYLALKGCRTGLVIGTIGTMIAIPFAILMGVSAGYFGGWVDDVVQYLYTTLASIPSILFIAAVMVLLQATMGREQSIYYGDRKLIWLCIILGAIGWTGLCRLLRAETLKLREMEYVQAAHAVGVSHVAVMFRHILPNLLHIVLISMVLRFSGLVLSEAVLTYVGIGVDPSMESWGNMVNAARAEVARDPIIWWNLLAAFLFLFGLVLPANVFGDAARDALDPRLRTE